MKKVIIWKGLHYQSMEYCDINIDNEQLEVASTILGVHEGKEYKVDYVIIANPNWEVVSCRVEIRLGAGIDIQKFKHDGEGNWTKNGKTIDEYKGCMDIDISVTPFTNALPINRLQLQANEVRQIRVLYVDVLGQAIKSVVQQYTKISDHEYQYANVPNDFEAVITVDKLGLVTEYPGLFTRL